MRKFTKKTAVIIVATLALLVCLVATIFVSAKYIKTLDGTPRDITIESALKTTLYENGALIINEKLENHASNVESYGQMVKSYPALHGSETYSWTSPEQVLWANEASQVKYVLIGDNSIAPTSTAFWFNGFCNPEFTTIDLSKLNTASVTNMQSMFQGCKNLTNITVDSSFTTAGVTDFSNMFSGCSSLTKDGLPISGFSTAIAVNLSGMFKDCSALTAIDISLFNTPNVQRTDRMFQGCSKLTSLDITNLDTSQVTTMAGMFQGCSKLSSLDTTEFNTSLAQDMSCLFEGCSGLTGLNLAAEGFSTANATNLSGMFQGCINITELNLEKFDTSKVTNMTDMFKGMSLLVTIEAEDTFTTGKLDPSTQAMFDGCSALEGGAGTQYANEPEATRMNSTYAHIDGGETDKGYFASARPHLFYGVQDGVLYLSAKKTSQASTNNDEALASTSKEKCGWNTDRANITSVIIQDDTPIIPTRMDYWFADFEKCTTISNMVIIDTENTTSMRSLFHGCALLGSIDLSGFNTQNVTDMSSMFDGCKTVTTLAVEDLNTSNVTQMQGMFAGCENLGTLDLSEFDTQNVTNMKGMFAVDKTLTQLNLSSFDTSAVTNTASMFENSSSIKTINVGTNFNTSESEDMSHMFAGCEALTGFQGNATFNTTSAKDLSYMYQGCKVITAIDTSGFNTANVTDMKHMFDGCETLTALAVGGFNTAKVTDMSYMFNGCKNVDEIDTSKFAFGECLDTSYMFANCQTINRVEIDDETSKVANMKAMFQDCSNVTTFSISAMDTTAVTDMSYMFSGCSGATAIDTSNFETAESPVLAKVECMFQDCSIVSTLDITKLNTTGVSSFESMFNGCSGLTTLNVSNIMKTNSATNMAMMFMGCENLTSIDTSNFNTANVTTMAGMFDSCAKLGILDLSSFNTKKLSDSTGMFAKCKKLESIYATANFDKKEIQESEEMFDECKTLDGGDGTEWLPTNPKDKSYANIDQFNTSGVHGYFRTKPISQNKAAWWFDSSTGTLHLSGTDRPGYTRDYRIITGFASASEVPWSSSVITSVVVDPPSDEGIKLAPKKMDYWFAGQTSMTSIPEESFANLDTSDLTSMNYTFNGCTGLTEINLLTFSGDSITSMDHTFAGCTDLVSIYVTAGNWDASASTSSDTFTGDDNLIGRTIDGAHVTKYSEAGVTGMTYAHMDSATSPGYFSPASSSNLQNQIDEQNNQNENPAKDTDQKQKLDPVILNKKEVREDVEKQEETIKPQAEEKVMELEVDMDISNLYALLG